MFGSRCAAVDAGASPRERRAEGRLRLRPDGLRGDTSAMLDRSLGEVLADFAAKTPTPGGGAAAALAGALGASLCLMAVRFSMGRKGMEARHAELKFAERALATALDRLLPMAEKDCGAYDAVSAAYKLPKAT